MAERDILHSNYTVLQPIDTDWKKCRLRDG